MSKQMIMDCDRIDLAEEFSTKDFLLSEDIMYEGDKVKILQKVKSQRQHVEEAMTKLKDEESVQNFTQYDIERQLMDNITEKQFSKYKKLLNKLETITHLIFSLSVRINEKKILNSKHQGLVMLMYQMNNAKEVLVEIEKNLEQFLLFLSVNINPKFCDTFTNFINKKKHNICLRRALVRELYFIHLKFDIVNLL